MKTKSFFFFALLLFISMGFNSRAGKVLDSDWKYVVSGSCSDQTAGWWSSTEAIRIAENVLLYQRDVGGWPKNTNMQNVLSQAQKDKLIADKPSKSGDYCTIDNGAVTYELTYLSKVYAAIAESAIKTEIKTGFLKGIKYLLDAQYPNGGWPQFYPLRGGYSDHITYNDDAMTRVMIILGHIYKKDGYFSIGADENTVVAAKAAFDKGVECILKTQYVQQGLLTTWCAQHDYKTLIPALARSYELPSLSGSESGKLLEFLMTLENPSYKIRRAIYYGVNWYDDTRIKGIKVESFTNSDGLKDLRVVASPGASDLWARFYTLENNTPFFCDRDGIKKYSLAEIGHERRNGYSWYVSQGSSVFSAYNSWYAKWGSNTEQETLIQSPVDKTTLLSTNTIQVKANANEYKFGCIKKFELFIDGVLINDFASPKIDTQLADLSVGLHTIIAKSTDDKGFITSDTSSITIIPGFNLEIISGTGDGNYAEGAKVNIKAENPPTGKLFEKWTGDTIFVTDVYKASTTVTMPASKISLTAVYKDKPSGKTNYATKGKELHCYPNPANPSFSIDLSEIGNSKIEIYTLSGQSIYVARSTNPVHIINNHNLKSGIFLLKVTDSSNHIYTKKLLIE